MVVRSTSRTLPKKLGVLLQTTSGSNPILKGTFLLSSNLLGYLCSEQKRSIRERGKITLQRFIVTRLPLMHLDNFPKMTKIDQQKLPHHLHSPIRFTMVENRCLHPSSYLLDWTWEIWKKAWQGRKGMKHEQHRFESYCWWTKSCTTKDDDYPIIYRVLTIPGGAGFLPSTVSLASIKNLDH